MFAEIPELFLSIIVCPRMQQFESIRFLGWERYSDIEGYIRNMRFNDFSDSQPFDKNNQKVNEIVAMDAIQGANHTQFGKEMILRELHKACCAFATSGSEWLKINPSWNEEDATKPVATGFWGCGVFGGDKQLKVIIQWLAASMCGRPSIDIHVFSPDDQSIETEFNERIAPLLSKSPKVGSIARALVEDFAKSRRETKMSVFDFIVKQLE